MGKLVSGINGPFIGKVGEVIGSSRNGTYYMKGLYRDRKTKVSANELLNRRKFAAAQLWLKPLVEFIRIGFNGYSAKSGAFLGAKSYLMKHVLKVEGDEIIIDPALVKISWGDLPLPADAGVSMTGPGKMHFNWTTIDKNTDYDRDQVMMLAYDIEARIAYYVTAGQFRCLGYDTMDLPSKLPKGTVLHTYMAFIAVDRSRQSDSLYLGEVVV